MSVIHCLRCSVTSVTYRSIHSGRSALRPSLQVGLDIACLYPSDMTVMRDVCVLAVAKGSQSYRGELQAAPFRHVLQVLVVLLKLRPVLGYEHMSLSCRSNMAFKIPRAACHKYKSSLFLASRSSSSTRVASNSSPKSGSQQLEKLPLLCATAMDMGTNAPTSSTVSSRHLQMLLRFCFFSTFHCTEDRCIVHLAASPKLHLLEPPLPCPLFHAL